MGDNLHPVVSDHALLRWFERRLGLDVEAVRREIGAVCARGAAAGAAAVTYDGMRFCLRYGAAGPVVATVMPKRDAGTGRPAVGLGRPIAVAAEPIAPACSMESEQ